MRFISDTEKKAAQELDFVVRGDGRGARIQSVAWTVDGAGAKTIATARGVRPATREEVALWRALCQALRLQVR